MMPIVLGFVAGIALGALYFGGLWLTVRNMRQADHAAGRIVLSFFGRAALLLAGFYGVLQLGLTALAAAMVAFLAVRFAATRYVSPTPNDEQRQRRTAD